MQGWGRGLCLCCRGKPIRTAFHTISILANSFCESYTWRLVSWKALKRTWCPLCATYLPVYEDGKSNESDEKSVRRIIASNKAKRTDTIATKFIREQVKKVAGKLQESSRRWPAWSTSGLTQKRKGDRIWPNFSKREKLLIFGCADSVTF